MPSSQQGIGKRGEGHEGGSELRDATMSQAARKGARTALKSESRPFLSFALPRGVGKGGAFGVWNAECQSSLASAQMPTHMHSLSAVVQTASVRKMRGSWLLHAGAACWRMGIPRRICSSGARCVESGRNGGWQSMVWAHSCPSLIFRQYAGPREEPVVLPSIRRSQDAGGMGQPCAVR